MQNEQSNESGKLKMKSPKQTLKAIPHAPTEDHPEEEGHHTTATTPTAPTTNMGTEPQHAIWSGVFGVDF